MKADPLAVAHPSRSAHDGGAPATVEVAGVDVGYGGPPVLRDVTFAARAGDRVGVLGPNGGGKSTLFRLLLGELRPRGGEVRLAGLPALVPQTERSRLDYPVSALDVALMGALLRRPWWRPPGRAERRRARAALEVVGLAEHADRRFGSLSGGQRQRVLVARALVQDAAVVLLVEPFAGLDERSADALDATIDRLAAEGRTLLIATHDMDQVRAWDEVLCLNGRQVAYGPPATTLTRAVLEATYGGAIRALPAGDDELVPAVLPAHHCDDGR